MTVVSHFREILNCELRERRPCARASEYRRDMHYTMDARFSRLISLKSTRSTASLLPSSSPPLRRPVHPGVFPGYRSRKSNLRKYTRGRAARRDAANTPTDVATDGYTEIYRRAGKRDYRVVPIILNALINAEVERILDGLGGVGYKKISGTVRRDNGKRDYEEARDVKSTDRLERTCIYIYA